MKSKIFRLFFIVMLSTTLFGWALPVQAAKIRIITTLTDLADFARSVGGSQVDVRSLATGVEDTHGVPMKPSFVPLLNRADIVILVGMDCEHAFLPALLEASKNPRIQKGRTGYVDCSKGIIPREVPRSTGHYQGDVHPEGNPHYMLDPVLAKTAINNIYNALVEFAPQHKAEFTRNRNAYIARLDAKIIEWRKEASVLKGAKFVSYHEHWPYFSARFGMEYFGMIEVKPGIDPTPRHIEELSHEALIKFENLGIGYNGQPVLSGISLSIVRNSFTVILGENGSGKSTLLKTLLGLIPPVSGRIETATGNPLIFGYVPQTTEFDPVFLLTGYEVALMGTYGRVRPGRIVRRNKRLFTNECLAAAGAQDFAHRQFSELSGGQKQRARALAARPDVLALDEPTAGVDHAATHAVMDFISHIRTERRITILLVTHDFAVARRHADQVIWLHESKALPGTAGELLNPKGMAEILEMETD